MLTEDAAKRVLGPYESRIANVILSAWSKWRALPPEAILSLSRCRARANVLSAFMHDYIAELEGTPGLVLIERYGTTTVMIEDSVLVRFKKLHWTGLSSNYPTQRSLDFNGQMPLPDVPLVERVDAGYVLDRAGIRIEDVLISYRKDSRVVWKYSIAGGSSAVEPIAVPSAPEGPAPKGRVSVKGEDRNADENASG